MDVSSAFLTHPIALSKGWSGSRIALTTRRRIKQTYTPTAMETGGIRPDAGLIKETGITGTLCTNLWPIPILGGYGWFLNVYDRELAAKTGPFVINWSGEGDVRLGFEEGRKREEKEESGKHVAFSGVVTGNINVKSAMQKMEKEGDGYMVRIFEKGGKENVLQRRNEVHAVTERSGRKDSEVADLWNDAAPTYKVISQASAYEVREVYSGGGSLAREGSAFEYFAMNLSPIFPFAKYSCFVCVWKQRAGTCGVAIDKYEQDIRLSFFDPVETTEGTEWWKEGGGVLGRFAVTMFYGPVTDRVVASEHRRLLSAIAASPSTSAVSEVNFRIVVDNSLYTFGGNRKNELWVEVK